MAYIWMFRAIHLAVLRLRGFILWRVFALNELPCRRRIVNYRRSWRFCAVCLIVLANPHGFATGMAGLIGSTLPMPAQWMRWTAPRGCWKAGALLVRTRAGGC